jgi:hypothetical protein
MDLLEPQPVPNALHLLDERLDRPERRFVRPRGLTAAELVVEDDAPALGERRERGQRQVRAARAAVQAEQR